MKFKKYLSSLIILTMICSVFSATVFAEGEPTDGEVIATQAQSTQELVAVAAAVPTLTVSSKTVHTAQTPQSIMIETKNAGNLAALEFDVTYDSAALAQMNVKISQGVHCKTNVVGNTVSYALADANGLDLSKVCELAFVVNGSSAITVTNVKAWNAAGTEVKFAVKNGEMKLDTNIPLGDATGDHNIDIMDILRIQDEILGRQNAVLITSAADMNQDGVVDVLDIVAIQDYILGRK